MEGQTVGDLAWNEIGKGITRKRGSDSGLSRDSIAPLATVREKHLIQGMVLPVLALLFLLASPAGLRPNISPCTASSSKLLTLGRLFPRQSLESSSHVVTQTAYTHSRGHALDCIGADKPTHHSYRDARPPRSAPPPPHMRALRFVWSQKQFARGPFLRHATWTQSPLLCAVYVN